MLLHDIAKGRGGDHSALGAEVALEVGPALGLTDEEAAEAMGLKLRTMQRTWTDARRWLYTHMEPGHAQSAG